MWPGPAPLAGAPAARSSATPEITARAAFALARATGRTCGGSNGAMRGLPHFARACERRACLCCAALACQLRETVSG